MTYHVAEIFSSINGEGPLAGELALFIRFAGCNLSCSYCDTDWAREAGSAHTPMTAEDILDVVRASAIKNITLTGGEPLLRENMPELIDLLLKEDRHVEIETNGSIDLAPCFKFRDSLPKERRDMLSLTVDYKLPSSGMEEHMLEKNFRSLSENDSVKFVAGDKADLVRALEIMERYALRGRCRVFISPVYGCIDPEKIVEFMKGEKLNGVRLSLQLHKIIWDPAMRGV